MFGTLMKPCISRGWLLAGETPLVPLTSHLPPQSTQKLAYGPDHMTLPRSSSALVSRPFLFSAGPYLISTYSLE